jgi:phosphate transport system protein
MHLHTVKAYGEELNQLAADITLMGGVAEKQIAESIKALSRRDVALAKKVIEADQKLDDMQRDIERKAIRLIALRQPMAQDLRRAVGAMKIAASLERVGDMSKNIAKRALVLAETEPMTGLSASIERMGKLVLGRIKEVIDAYSRQDVEAALAVWERDTEVDEHYNALFRELLTYMMGDPRTIGAGTHLLFAAKNLERIGDHATNIAEMVHFEATGRDVGEDRPRWEGVEG